MALGAYERDIVKYVNDTNRIINCADPGKDAATRDNDRQILNADPHGYFLKNNVIGPLFRGNIDNNRWEGIKGCGKSTIIDNILDEQKLGLIIKSREISITNSATGENLGLRGCNFVEDGVSIVPKRYDYINNQHALSNSKRIYTPGDIFDSMNAGSPSRYMRNNVSTYHIEKRYTLSKEDFEVYALSDIVHEIEFIPGPPHRFRIQTNIEGYEDRIFKFNEHFNSDNNIFHGNTTKNNFILHNYTDTTKLKDIQFRVLVKLLGDLLKIIYVKELFKEKNNYTYITTRDTTVKLRALLNNVQCIVREGGWQNSYIMVYDLDLTNKHYELRRGHLLDKLQTEYRTTQDNLLKFMLLIGKYNTFMVESDVSFTLRVKLPLEAQKELEKLLEKMEMDLDKKYEEIRNNTLSFGINEMNKIQEYLYKNQIKCPFIVQVDSTKEQEALNGKKSEMGVILPMMKIFKQYDTTNILKFLEKYTERFQFALEALRFNFTLGGGKSPEKPEAKSDIGDYLKANKEHGFFAFFVITYLPNVLLTSYAYAMTTDIDYKKFNRFFGEDTIRMCEIFGKPYDYVFDSYGEGRKEDDELMHELCSIGSAAYKQRGDFSIFDYADDDTREFFTIIDGKHAFKEYANSLAKDTYQALYYAEVSRVILNQPSNGDPLKVEEHAMDMTTPTKSSKKKRSATKSKPKTSQRIRPVAKRTKSAWSRKPVLKTIVPRTQTRKIVA